jgi:hypothetical protein
VTAAVVNRCATQNQAQHHPKSSARRLSLRAIEDVALPEGRQLDQVVVGNSFHRMSGLAPGTKATGDYVDFESELL